MKSKGLKWSATAGRPRWKKSKFMTVPLTIFRLSPSPQFKSWARPPHFKNCSAGPAIPITFIFWFAVDNINMCTVSCTVGMLLSNLIAT